ncbi:MAG: sugar ABC transporter permease [Clostridia bacterium]|nr:sugar ABC transporter permease [Clostridia bacterium]MBR4359973.1 sugar ABC transporter permease [Clostridia bacterium]
MRSRNARTGVLFVLPFILGFLLFMVTPLVQSVIMSLNKVVLVPGEGYQLTWNNFENYKYAMGVDPYFNQYLVDESGRMAINATATLVLSFVIAVILNQKFKGRTMARAIFFLPVILASGVLPGVEKQLDFNMLQGVSDEIAAQSGVNISASLQNLLSISGVGSGVFDVLFDMIDAIYDIVMASGIQIIVFLSGLSAISPSLYEAADVEGCTAWEAFWKITFPMVSPLLLVNAIYTIIDFFMKNDNKVMEWINTQFTRTRYGESTAESWIYFGVALAFIGIASLVISRVVKQYDS